jgi:LemA protein
MKVLLTLIVIVVVIGLIFGLAYWGTFHANIAADEDCIEKVGNICVMEQRRFDLVPNLVEAVKGFMGHEKDVIQGAIDARAKATQVNVDLGEALKNPALFRENPEIMQQFEAAKGEFESALSRLLVTVERYPESKANEMVQDLMAQLEGSENRIAYARTEYNKFVKTLNKRVRGLWSGWIARSQGIEQRVPFELKNPEAANAPTVSFD